MANLCEDEQLGDQDHGACHFLRVTANLCEAQRRPAALQDCRCVPFSKGNGQPLRVGPLHLLHVPFSKGNGQPLRGGKAPRYYQVNAIKCHFLRVWPTFARTSSSATKTTEVPFSKGMANLCEQSCTSVPFSKGMANLCESTALGFLMSRLYVPFSKGMANLCETVPEAATLLRCSLVPFSKGMANLCE